MTAVATLIALLATYQITLKNPDHFVLQAQSVERSADRKIQNIKFVDGDTTVDLVLTGPLEDAAFANYLKLETVSFEHLYAPGITPYPGKITNRQNCDAKMLPRKSTQAVFGIQSTVWQAKANSRKSFGTCLKSEAAFDGAMSIVHLPNHYAVKISVFAKSDKTALKELGEFGFSAAP